MHGAVWLDFVVDVVGLRGALQGVVDRHEMLRTTFADLDGEPVQVIAPSQRVELSVVSLRDVAVEGREAEAQRLATVEAQRPFDLRRGPLLRFGLIELDVDRWLFVVTLHHIVCDGWSLGGVVARSSPRSIERAVRRPVAVTGASYPVRGLRGVAARLVARRHGRRTPRVLARAARRLGDVELPTDRPRPAVQRLRRRPLSRSCSERR